MVESIGSRSPRWMQIKREEFLSKQDAKTGTASDRRIMPHSIVRQSSRTQQTLSSISCSSRSSSGLGSGGEEYATRDQSSPRHGKTTDAARGKARDGEIDTIKGGHIPKDAKKISSASSSNSNQQSSLQSSSSNDFHHYNATDLPDSCAVSDGRRPSFVAKFLRCLLFVCSGKLNFQYYERFGVIDIVSFVC